MIINWYWNPKYWDFGISYLTLGWMWIEIGPLEIYYKKGKTK